MKLPQLMTALLFASPALALAAPADQLANLLVGEYNNNEQVWQQDLDKVELYPRKHVQWQTAEDAPDGDGKQLLLGITDGQGPAAADFRVQLSASNGAVTSTVMRLTPTAQPPRKPCTYTWRAEGSSWIGTVNQRKNCSNELPDRWEIDADYLLSTLTIGKGRRQQAIVLQARRATRYTGWYSLKRNKIDPSAAEDDYIFVADNSFHDESHIEPILDNGKPTGYAIELARLTYQNTGVAVLKVGIIEQATGKTLAYSWSNPHAQRVGINLRWVQAGLTRAISPTP